MYFFQQGSWNPWISGLRPPFPSDSAEALLHWMPYYKGQAVLLVNARLIFFEILTILIAQSYLCHKQNLCQHNDRIVLFSPLKKA